MQGSDGEMVGGVGGGGQGLRGVRLNEHAVDLRFVSQMTLSYWCIRILYLLFSLFYSIISIKKVYNGNLRTCVSKRTRARISTTPNLFQTVALKTVRQASYSVFAIVKSMLYILLLQSVIKIVTFFWKMYIN